MELLPLGVGDAFTRRYFTTCFVVQAEGATLMVDCPHPIRRMMAEADPNLDIGDLDAVVITHLHADHASGLEGLLFFAFFALRRKIRLVAHPEVLNVLWEGKLRASMCELMEVNGEHRHLRLEDMAELVPLSEEVPTQVGPFQVACRRTIHHIPTFALRLTAGGRTLGISSDTSFDPTLIDWLNEADRFIHETNLGTHTPYASLAALPQAVRHKMWIHHFTDDFDLENSVIEPLRQGQRYTI